jgi:hypothetical protein
MPPAVPCLTTLRHETIERLGTLPFFKHVYDSRLPQLRRDLLPALRVYTSATSQGLSISIPEFRTTAALVVQIVCEDTTDAKIAERVDRYCELVKARLLRDGKWLQLFERVLSIDTEIERSVEGEWRLTTATLSFSLQYTEAWEPFVPDWLESMKIEVDVIAPAADPNVRFPGPDGRIEVDARVTNKTPPPPSPIDEPFVTKGN